MAEIVAHFTNQGVPLVAPGNVPTIRIRRIDTGALVVTDQAMTEIGDGNFSYTFVTVSTLEYSVRADGDPTAAGQTTAQERYQFGGLSGITEERIEGDIPDILADTAAMDPLVSANLDAKVSDVEVDTQNIQTRLPASLVGGRMRGHVEAMDAGSFVAGTWTTAALQELADHLETAGTNPHGTGVWTGPTPAAVAASVWSFDLTAYVDEDLAGGMVNWTYRAMYHRQEVDFNAQRLVLYNKAGTNVVGYWPLADGDGGAVAKATGSPARRGVFV